MYQCSSHERGGKEANANHDTSQEFYLCTVFHNFFHVYQNKPYIYQFSFFVTHFLYDFSTVV